MIAYAPDIEAEITFVPTEAGGRKRPIRSDCYKPQFHYDDHDWDSVLLYDQKELVFPGETIVAKLSFMSPAYHVGRLYPDKTFEFREGARVVAQGHVIKIIHLVESAMRMGRENGYRYFKRYFAQGEQRRGGHNVWKDPSLYFRYCWPKDYVDDYAKAGGATCYFACLPNGDIEQQIELCDSSSALICHKAYQPLDLPDLAPYEISAEEFWQAISMLRPYNRSEESSEADGAVPPGRSVPPKRSE